jgi:tetratricopeptide (TPR) repeat protein
MTDHDSPINPSLDSSDLEQVPPTWVNQHSDDKIENFQEIISSLDDTQKIRVFPEDPEELVTQAFNSIESGNIKFAYKCFNKLIRDNYKLNEWSTQLEEICRQYPADVDLWFVLGEVYKKLGLEEKSLAALEEAQNNLSF